MAAGSFSTCFFALSKEEFAEPGNLKIAGGYCLSFFKFFALINPYPTPIANKTYTPLSIGQIEPSARQLHPGSQPGSRSWADIKDGKIIKPTIKIQYIITGFKRRFIEGVLVAKLQKLRTQS